MLLVSAISVCFDFDMSAKGQSRHFDCGPAPSGLPQRTDIVRLRWLVRFVPQADSCTAAIDSLAGQQDSVSAQHQCLDRKQQRLDAQQHCVHEAGGVDGMQRKTLECAGVL